MEIRKREREAKKQVKREEKARRRLERKQQKELEATTSAALEKGIVAWDFMHSPLALAEVDGDHQRLLETVFEPAKQTLFKRPRRRKVVPALLDPDILDF